MPKNGGKEAEGSARRGGGLIGSLLLYAGRIARSRSKLYNAYILVYVKKSQANQLLADCSPLKVSSGARAPRPIGPVVGRASV